MSRKLQKTCDELWLRLKEAVYAQAEREHTGEFKAVDRMRDGAFYFLENLLDEEVNNERIHRKLAPTGVVIPVSSRLAAMVTLLHNIAEGTKKTHDPGCSIFFVVRPSAAYGLSIGFLLRNQLSQAWISEALALDYSAIMGVEDAHK